MFSFFFPLREETIFHQNARFQQDSIGISPCHRTSTCLPFFGSSFLCFVNGLQQTCSCRLQPNIFVQIHAHYATISYTTSHRQSKSFTTKNKSSWKITCPEEVVHLAQFLCTQLDIRFKDIGACEINEVHRGLHFDLPHFRHLQRFRLDWSIGWGKSEWRACLAGLSECSCVEVLELTFVHSFDSNDNNQLGSDLPDFSKFESLTALRLKNMGMSNRMVSAILSCQILQILSISHCARNMEQLLPQLLSSVHLQQSLISLYVLVHWTTYGWASLLPLFKQMRHLCFSDANKGNNAIMYIYPSDAELFNHKLHSPPNLERLWFIIDADSLDKESMVPERQASSSHFCIGSTSINPTGGALFICCFPVGSPFSHKDIFFLFFFVHVFALAFLHTLSFCPIAFMFSLVNWKERI